MIDGAGSLTEGATAILPSVILRVFRLRSTAQSTLTGILLPIVLCVTCRATNSATTAIPNVIHGLVVADGTATPVKLVLTAKIAIVATTKPFVPIMTFLSANEIPKTSPAFDNSKSKK